MRRTFSRGGRWITTWPRDGRGLLVLVLGLLCVPHVTLADFPAFKLHHLNPSSEFSACAVFDVNRDGQVDLFCGGFWYEAPTWRRHLVRTVESIRGRFDDYSNLPLDVNHDGWIDVVSVNYRSQSLYWVRNPGDSLGTWEKTVIDTPGPSETGRLVDIDGDGQADVLPNGTRFAAWYEVVRNVEQPDANPVHWVRHELPADVAGHGLGFGDLDGDGHGDLVTSKGWWRGPDDPRGGVWSRRAEFLLHADAGIPILTHDVDEDGDLDVIWGRGHNVGLYWLEQQSDGQNRVWAKHAIDTDWSCIHTLGLADLTGDGRMELVAGKRYLGHDGKDPGEWTPRTIRAYAYDRVLGAWRSHDLAPGADVGFDLGFAAADIDGDGDIDLVAPSRKGLAYLENLGKSATESAPGDHANVPTYAADEPLLLHRSVSGDEVPITSRIEWGHRVAQIRSSLERVMGPLPKSDRRSPLNVQVESRTQADGYDRIKLTYEAEPGDRVPAYLLLPHDSQEPAPALLCLHPTHPSGKGQIVGLTGQPSRFYAHELAQQGFICLAPDYPSFGDYLYDFSAEDEPYVSGTMKAIWNNIRAIDLLESWPGVDVDRIGCIGHSLGGHNALFTAAFDLRLRAVVTSCGFTSMANYYAGDLTGWTSDRYMPRIKHEYGSDPTRLPFDFHEVLAAIAPRPLFINAPLHDDNFDVAGVRQTVQRVQPVYELFEAADKLEVVYPDVGHDFPTDVRTRIADWLRKQL